VVDVSRVKEEVVKDEPPEGICAKCKQTRNLFHYKTLHDCVKDTGSVSLVEAAEHILWLEENQDYWCLRRLERLPQSMLCTSCFQVETASEQEFIDNVLENS
jgi:hypothetical protein